MERRGRDAKARRARHPATLSLFSQFVGSVFCYCVCLGMLDREERAELFGQATAQMRSEAQRGRTSVAAMIGSCWKVMRETIRHREPRRWEWQKALRLLVDVPMHAAMTAIPLAFGVIFIFAVLHHAAIGVVAGLLVGCVALLTRSLNAVRREIRLAEDPTYLESPTPEAARIVTWANVLTLLRLVPLGVVVPILSRRGQASAAFFLFLAAVVGDCVDGYIARHFHQETKVGCLFDPLVDRLVMILGMVGLLLAPPTLPSALVLAAWIIIIRDLLVVVLGAVFYAIDKSPKPNQSAHVASILEMIGVSCAYLALVSGNEQSSLLGVGVPLVLAGSLVAGIISFWHYQRALTAGMTWGRAEAFAEEMPARALDVAFSRLDIEPLDRALRQELDNLILASDDSQNSPCRLVIIALRRLEEELIAAKEKGLYDIVGQLEERRRNLLALRRRLCEAPQRLRHRGGDNHSPL